MGPTTDSSRFTRFLKILGVMVAVVLTAAACGTSAGAGDEAQASTTVVRPRPAARPTVVGSQTGADSSAGSESGAQSTPGSGNSGEGEDTKGSSQTTYLATILIGTSSVSGEPSGCNSDQVLGNVIVDLYLEGDQTITGVVVDSGSSVTAVSRCDGTSYGGLRDVGDDLFEVSGELTTEGVHLVISPVDEFEWYLGTGTSYGTASLFEAVLPYAEAITEGVSGTAADFVIEADTMASLTDSSQGESATFRGSDPHDDGAWWESEITVYFFSTKQVNR